nr:hypothetical protein [uncultured Flavobacterium sp.]
MKNSFKNSSIVLTAFILTQFGAILLAYYYKVAIGVTAGGLLGIPFGPTGVLVGETIGAILDHIISK